MEFTTLDYIVFGLYALTIVGIGLWVSREKEGHEKNTTDYFLAGKALPFWAIGASLIASNISAEQFIGMSGSGFRVGLAIASYEWMAAVTLLVIAWFFLPIYLEKNIYTMPQFLENRYDARVRTLLAVFWLLVYVFVNLTSVLYLGALALQNIMGAPLWVGLVGLALFATIYSIYGGLEAVAWTDVVQVVVLIAGGLLTTWLALDAYGDGAGVVAGFSMLFEDVTNRFNMILFEGELLYQDPVLEDGEPVYTATGELVTETKDAYQLLPGLGVLLGGMWVANLFYWGCNQYIIQRALAAKSLKEAQRGLAFAGYLKLILPLIVVIPGIVAYALEAPITKADEAYPWLLSTYIGPGLRGLAVAALAAAIVSSLASMMNSTATIFTMDLYKTTFDRDASEGKLVTIGADGQFGGDHDCGANRLSTFGGHRPGLPVHPGVHRLYQPGRIGGVSDGPVLEKSDGQRRTHHGHSQHPALDGHEIPHAGRPLYEPDGLRFCDLDAADRGDFVLRRQRPG